MVDIRKHFHFYTYDKSKNKLLEGERFTCTDGYAHNQILSINVINNDTPVDISQYTVRFLVTSIQDGKEYMQTNLIDMSNAINGVIVITLSPLLKNFPGAYEGKVILDSYVTQDKIIIKPIEYYVFLEDY